MGVWNEVLCAPHPVLSIFKSFSSLPNHAHIAQRSRKEQGSKQQTVKIDVVADNGRKWIRINTLKNARLLAEFREIDSYDTDSSSDEETDRPSLAQKEFDNTLLQMGRDLIAASRVNPLPSGEHPQVVLCLTRLDPEDPDGDQRIGTTVQCLRDMGIHVVLGERSKGDLPPPPLTEADGDGETPVCSQPTERINLDLSILIALVSDLTHAPLPPSIEEAQKRFVPPQKYMDWKKARANGKGKRSNGTVVAEEQDSSQQQSSDNMDSAIELDVSTHSKALMNQCLQEMGKGMVQEIHDRISGLSNVEFWTTSEAKERCLRIVSKIGGEREKRRVHALFPDTAPAPGLQDEKQHNPEAHLWDGSRYPASFVHFLPIRIYTEDFHDDLTDHPLSDKSPHPFFSVLADTCSRLLNKEEIPHPRPPPRGSQIERAAVMKANPKLTAHTVQSLALGAKLGWTTLTANKASVKVILREIATHHLPDLPTNGPNSIRSVNGNKTHGGPTAPRAAIWITDPRSLAEGMRSDS